MSVVNTMKNKQRRMAKHAMRYPHKDPRSAATRRAISKAWKIEAARRAAAYVEVATT